MVYETNDAFSREKNKRQQRRKIFKERRENFWKGLSQTAWAFCYSTSLHGMRHIANDFQEMNNTSSKLSHSRKKRIWTKVISIFVWGGAGLIGTTFAFILMSLIWQRFQTTPTVTTVETNYFPIWNIQFPAVTVCNLNKVSQRGVKQSDIQLYLSNLANLVRPQFLNLSDGFNVTLPNIQRIMRELDYTPEKVMQEVMQPCDNLMKNCYWLGKLVECSSLFRIAKTSEGFCCSFNYNDINKPLEAEKRNSTRNKDYYVSGAGEEVALNMLIDASPLNYKSYVRSYYGIQILIHSPDDFPEASVNKVVSQPGYNTVVLVKPFVVVSEPGVRSLDVKQRGCLFEDENMLRSDDRYSFISCITECRVDAIIRMCNCIPFYYPQLRLLAYSQRYKQCTLIESNCLYLNRHYFSSIQPPANTKGFSSDSEQGLNCSCLPSCAEENYELQIVSANRKESPGLYSPVYRNFNDDMLNFTTVSVFFKDTSCIKYRRDMHMTWDDLFASFGGIFGLCLGGSIISLVEILYFFTVGLIIRIVENKKQQIQQIINANRKQCNTIFSVQFVRKMEQLTNKD